MHKPDTAPRQADPSGLPTVELKGVRFHAISEADCVQYVYDEIDAGRGGWIVTLNSENLRRCTRYPDEGAFAAKSDLVVADGMPLIWASVLRGTPFPERVTGSNLIWSLSAECARRNHSVFLMGGAPGSADAAGKVLLERNPSLSITGTYCPPFGFEAAPAEWAKIGEALRANPADLIFVGLGFPKQEIVIERFRAEFPSAWWIGVGISFSFVAGDVHRAPGWMQRIGLEWFHRFLQEPGRLFKRYFLHDIPFACNLLATSAFERFSGSRRRRKAAD